MNKARYIIKKDFMEYSEEQIFTKKLELLCLEYDAELDWDYIDEY